MLNGQERTKELEHPLEAVAGLPLSLIAHAVGLASQLRHLRRRMSPLLAQSERQPDAEGYPPSGVKRT